MAYKFENPWAPGGEYYKQNALHTQYLPDGFLDTTMSYKEWKDGKTNATDDVEIYKLPFEINGKKQPNNNWCVYACLSAIDHSIENCKNRTMEEFLSIYRKFLKSKGIQNSDIYDGGVSSFHLQSLLGLSGFLLQLYNLKKEYNFFGINRKKFYAQLIQKQPDYLPKLFENLSNGHLIFMVDRIYTGSINDSIGHAILITEVKTIGNKISYVKYWDPMENEIIKTTPTILFDTKIAYYFTIKGYQ